MAYFVSTAILAATISAFFLLSLSGAAGEFEERFPKSLWILRIAVAVPLVVSGTMHFVRTDVMSAIVPPFLPKPVLLVWISGILEVAGAVGIFFRRTRRLASTCVALLMIAIFPANVYAANQVVGGWKMPDVPLRLAMQVIYILLLLTAGWGIPSRMHAKAGKVS